MAQDQVDGQQIRGLRIAADLTPMWKFLDALEREGVERSETTLYNIENGVTQPGDELLNAIARVLGCDRSALLLRPKPARRPATKHDGRPATMPGRGPS
jgi:transcriptional regulator with XRE-family HTH domain